MDIYHMTCPAPLATIFLLYVFSVKVEKLMQRTANFALDDCTSKSNLSAS